MSQRDSGYDRIAFDQYETPDWATLALVRHIPDRIKRIWEPACGSGKMLRALESSGFDVHGSDIQSGANFLSYSLAEREAIITNPPYSLATELIDHALTLSKPDSGFVAMLLRTDFDHAKSRRRLFADHRAFAKKLVLTRRIQWFEDSRSSPSFNHAWFIWDWENTGAPRLAYYFAGSETGLLDNVNSY